MGSGGGGGGVLGLGLGLVGGGGGGGGILGLALVGHLSLVAVVAVDGVGHLWREKKNNYFFSSTLSSLRILMLFVLCPQVFLSVSGKGNLIRRSWEDAGYVLANTYYHPCLLHHSS